MDNINPSKSTMIYRIRTSEAASQLANTNLFAILEHFFPVKFISNVHFDIEMAGEIRLWESLENKLTEDSINTWSLSVQSPHKRAKEVSHAEYDVQFSNDLEVPFPFRGRVIKASIQSDLPTLSLRENEKALATIGQRPIWAMHSKGIIKHFRSALSLPEIDRDQNFSDVFNGERFLEILPLLHFLREIGATTAYQRPPLRAGFIIDDPNLHWTRYGYIDYRAIISHAKAWNYHMSFATIPIDTWYTNSKTAELFRQNPQWLSLLIHGNNHGKNELAMSHVHSARTALLQQAIQRIERLEQREEQLVSRVMVPPHGACSSEMLAELPRCGFESACISAGSLRAHNPNKLWTKTLGFFPSETIEGCPVLPRWGLTGNVKNTLLIAAYLGQPMILRGHHQDFKNGIEIFDEFAKFINGLGDVFWSNMTNLSRLNYLWRMEGTTCHVKPLGVIIAIEPPSDTTDIIVNKFNANDNYTWRLVMQNGSMRKIESEEYISIRELSGQKLMLERIISAQRAISSEPVSARFLLRRLLTEIRDRFLIS